MTCNHTILRRIIFSPLSSNPVWECVDCGTYFDIEKREEQDWRK